MSDWNGRVAIVTGAASGIGRAAASRILEQGGRVVAVDLHEQSLDWLKDVDPAGERSRVIGGDVTEEATNAQAVAAAEALGGLDALLLNAGGLPALRKGRAPAIAVTASVSGLGGDPGLWAYNAAKGGVVNFVRSAALELGREGIRINAVCPGPIHTGMTTGILQAPPVHEELRRHIPLGRWGEADEVAAVLVFLTSSDASFVNGAIVPVDGGVSASSAQFTPWGPAIER